MYITLKISNHTPEFIMKF